MIGELFYRGERDGSRLHLREAGSDPVPDPEPDGEHGGVVSAAGETYGTRGPGEQSNDDEKGFESVVPSHCRRPDPGELDEPDTWWADLRWYRQGGAATFIDDPDRPGVGAERFAEAANCFLSRPRGDVYDSAVPYEYRDVVAPYEFEGVVREFDRVENLTSYEFTPAAAGRRAGIVRHCRQHPLDRSYSPRVLDRLDEWFNPTPEFAPSVAPDRVEIDDDGQTGLDDFDDDFAPCPHDEIEDCHCCLCPHCLSVAVRERLSKQPRFACGNPSCGEEGIEEVVVRPARREPAGD
jgi:hypothetical protein